MAFRGWERTTIRNSQGDIVNAIAPVIVSASRATDIPAFHAAWFMERLREGYVPWRNPFNAVQLQYVSFRNTRVVVFWSKNPAPLLPWLPEIEALGINYYVQFTLNDYEADGLELHLPPLAERVDTFMRFADRIGPDRVVWRFDPLVLTDTVSAGVLLDRIAGLAGRLQGSVRKLVISFADIDRYRSARRRLAHAATGAREFTVEEMRSFASQLVEANHAWGMELAACAEEVELEGIARNRCIDDDLLARCFGSDAVLMDFLGRAPLFAGQSAGKQLKDKGQRKACGCVVSKDIGTYGTCHHGCLYCYAQR